MSLLNAPVRPQFAPLVRFLVVGLLFLPLTSLFLAHPPTASAAVPSLASDVPAFVYETIYNGGYLDYGGDVAVDGGGNAYVLAYLYDSNNDILVLKLAPGGAVLWTTSISGSALDVGTGIEVDNAGIVYVTGWTDSTDFPLVNPLQSTLNGFRDAFLTKLSASDGSILYSTYFGGDRADGGNDLAVNSAGEVYLVGYTESTDLPTVNPIQAQLNTTLCFCADAFVAKISADGGTLLYGTYLGGAFDDEGRSIGLDAGGNIYIAGDTKSDDFPLSNPIQPNFAGGMRDVFAARISANGSALDYSTYLGGEEWDRVNRIAVDGAGHAYVAGSTRSIGFPTTPGAFQAQFVGGINECGSPPFEPIRNCDDAFLTKIAPDGSALAYSTFLGGHLDEEGHGVAVDSSGRAHIVGYTFSTDFPPAGSVAAGDIFVSRLDASGSSLDYTLGIDSNSPSTGHGIAVGDEGDVYLTGAANVPADVYVARLSGNPSPPDDTLHVHDISLQGQDLGRRYAIKAVIEVRDQGGAPVEGAEVTASLALIAGKVRVRTDVTDAAGQVTFRARSKTGGQWEVCVRDIVKDGFVYDASQNNETCDSLVYP